MNSTQTTRSGVILLFLMALLTGCGKAAPEVIRVPFETVRIEKVRVPAELLRPCRVPAMVLLETTRDLERVAIQAIASIADCNADKAAIEAWSEEE